MVFVTLRFRCLNLSRQFFGMSVLFIAYYFLRIGKNKLFCLFAVAAGFIHSTCFVFAPIYYFVYKFKDRIRFPPFLFSVVVYIILFILFEYIKHKVFEYSTFFSQILIKDGEFYNTEELLTGRFAWEERSLTRRAFLMLKDFLFLYWIKLLDKRDSMFNRYRDFFILSYFSIFAYMITGENEMSTRILLYLNVFYLICWGLLVRNASILKSKLNWYVFIMTLLIFFHNIYGIFPTLSEDFSKGMYIRYHDY